MHFPTWLTKQGFGSHNRIWWNWNLKELKWNSMKFDDAFGWQDFGMESLEDLESACLVGRM